MLTIYIMNLKDKKPIDGDMEKIKAQQTIDKMKEEWNRPVEYLKYKKANIRDPMPPLEVMFLKIKRGIAEYFKGVGEQFEIKFDMAISKAIKTFVIYYGWIIILLILGCIAFFWR